MKLGLISYKVINKIFANFKKEEKKIMAFGLEVLLSTLLSLLAFLCFSLLFKVTYSSLIVLFSAGSIKLISGGVHAKTVSKCALIGAIIFSLAGLVVEYLAAIITYNSLIVIIFFVLFISFLCIYLYAPANIHGNIIKDNYKKMKLKKYSFFLVAILISTNLMLLFFSDYQKIIIAILIGILVQMFMLTPIAYYLFNRDYDLGGDCFEKNIS